jgi:hypothetical protein
LEKNSILYCSQWETPVKDEHTKEYLELLQQCLYVAARRLGHQSWTFSVQITPLWRQQKQTSLK